MTKSQIARSITQKQAEYLLAADSISSDDSYKFSVDWTTRNVKVWEEIFKEAGFHIIPTNVLEIGCFEGRTSLWFLENLFINLITCVDPFEHPNIFHRLQHNLRNHLGAIEVVRESSTEALRRVLKDRLGMYDIIYVDGCHLPECTLEDAVLSWPLLRNGGFMVFDDYGWQDPPIEDRPKFGIDAFLMGYGSQLKIRHQAHQVIVEKVE